MSDKIEVILQRARATDIPYAAPIVHAAFTKGWTWAEDEDESAAGFMCFFREKNGKVESASIFHAPGHPIDFSLNGIPQEGWKLHRSEEYFA